MLHRRIAERLLCFAITHAASAISRCKFCLLCFIREQTEQIKDSTLIRILHILDGGRIGPDRHDLFSQGFRGI
ncbi:MAG: hypothetical protein ACK58T_26290, partial [Phycisphaerae bacterium]